MDVTKKDTYFISKNYLRYIMAEASCHSFINSNDYHNFLSTWELKPKITLVVVVGKYIPIAYVPPAVWRYELLLGYVLLHPWTAQTGSPGNTKIIH